MSQAILKLLLEDLVRTRSLVCTVGHENVVSELFIDEAVPKIELADPWAIIEFGSWHIHAHLDTVTHVRFAINLIVIVFNSYSA